MGCCDYAWFDFGWVLNLPSLYVGIDCGIWWVISDDEEMVASVGLCGCEVGVGEGRDWGLGLVELGVLGDEGGFGSGDEQWGMICGGVVVG
ncbi:hypothetical protein V6N13_054985 [Hibiscus sabdariffa]|uniref:Transmembrane protein n=1 Tax=Hibiscus sabdariffa TaxID=183260 RepID=A0ABR2DXC8_9ROSI